MYTACGQLIGDNSNWVLGRRMIEVAKLNRKIMTVYMVDGRSQIN